MLPRTLTSILIQSASTFPCVVITGPRQSGKTTLLRQLFASTHSYVNLEDLDTRSRATIDPRGFLANLKLPVIIDEVQYAPDLFSYIKSLIDSDRCPGNWLLTDSQNFALMSQVTQSLAGRAAILNLLPFSLAELENRNSTSQTVSQLLNNTSLPTQQLTIDLKTRVLSGGYPEPNTNPLINKSLWSGSYITTYLERDIRSLKQVGDLRQFELFVRSCATRTGQILDLSSLARDIGVSFSTAKRWLSLLETGYQIILLSPYYKNIGKRLTKRPKLYFTDTGLICYLLGLTSPELVQASPSFGALFETFVIVDFWKRFLHHGQPPSMYYIRSHNGLEVDLVIEDVNKLHLIELKSTQTLFPKHASSLIKVTTDLGSQVASSRIISATPNNFVLTRNISNNSWQSLAF